MTPAPVPPDGETDAPIPDWEFAGREEDRIRGAQEHAYARGFAAGRAAASPDPPDMTNMCEGESPDHKPGITPAASPDERLREALRTMIDVYDRHDRWCGHYAQAPGDGIIHRIDGARNALAAADREKPDEDQT